MSAHDPMAKYVEGMPDELQDILRKWSDRITENEALTARAVAAETALAAYIEAVHMSDRVVGAARMETIERALLDVPDQPTPTGDDDNA